MASKGFRRMAAHNFTNHRRLLPFGVTVAVAFLSGLMGALPGGMFASFTLFLCFLAAVAGASSRTVWAGIAQGSAYALILRWLFGTQFGASATTPGQSLCCALPLFTAFCAFLLFHRFTNDFFDRRKSATNLLFACRNFCLALACLYAAVASTSRTFVDMSSSYPAPLPAVHAPAFTSSDSYFTEQPLGKRETPPRIDADTAYNVADEIPGSGTLTTSNSVRDGSGTNLTGFPQRSEASLVRGLFSSNP